MASAASTSVGSDGRSSRRSNAAGSLHRSQEKDNLRQLNDRLANYIRRVQELECEKSSMLVLVKESEESKTREADIIRQLYERELADLRQSLDDQAGERARLQIEYGRLSEEYNKLQSRNQKDERDLANALAQWRKVEAALSSKDAQFTQLLSEKRGLNDDFTDVQGQLENVLKVKGVLADTKNQLTSEILRRVEMENQVQTLTDQLKLQKHMREQESQSRYESQLDLDSGRLREFESKLADTMQQLRQDHETQLQQYKEEMDKTFNLKLQNAQQAALEKNDVVSATRSELATAKVRVENLILQVQNYQKEKLVLEGRLQDLEKTFHNDRDVWQQKLCQKEQEMQIIRSQMYSQLEDYENLLDVKFALDMEISSYRKMLEVEEQRLQLSPSPSQRTTVTHTHEHSHHEFRGKKRKREGATGSSYAYKMSSHSTEHGAVSVAEVDVDGKYVRLKNNTETEQPLGGWVVQRMYPDIVFHIPPSCILSGGQTLTIWAAGAEVEADSGDLILQSHRSWHPVTNVRMVLLNANHEEMAAHRVCMQSSVEEETELESEVNRSNEGSDIQHFRRQPKRKKKCCSVS